MKIAKALPALGGYDWLGAVVAVALAAALMQVVPSGVAIAITFLTFMLWTGWRKRRADPAAAKAWLIDYGVAAVGCWAIAWTLILVTTPPLALLGAMSVTAVWIAWRSERKARLAE